MKAISRNLLSLLTEHNQTGTVVWDGGFQLVGNSLLFFFFFFCPTCSEKYLFQMERAEVQK